MSVELLRLKVEFCFCFWQIKESVREGEKVFRYYFSTSRFSISFYSSFSLSVSFSLLFSPRLQCVDTEPGLEELDVELFCFVFFWGGFEVREERERQRERLKKRSKKREREKKEKKIQLTRCSHSFACASSVSRILVTKMRIRSERPSSCGIGERREGKRREERREGERRRETREEEVR